MCWFNFICAYSLKDVFSIIQSISVAAGIIGGGYWFFKQRQKYPRANLSHEIFHKILPDGKILLQLQVKITNVGSVMISINKCIVRIQQILPMNDDILKAIKNKDEGTYTKGNDRLDCEIRWPTLEEFEHQCDDGFCEIEPNECEQFCYDFIIDPDVETVSIYSYFINKAVKVKKELGWSLTTIKDF
jgi:hypothetical protein